MGVWNLGETKRQILNHNVRDSCGDWLKHRKKCIYETMEIWSTSWIFDDTKKFLIMFKV